MELVCIESEVREGYNVAYFNVLSSDNINYLSGTISGQFPSDVIFESGKRYSAAFVEL